MTKETPTIYELLEEELQRRFFASGKKMTPDELFDKDKVCDWIESLVGRSTSGKLSSRIRETSAERLAHTASSYLLGMALRSRLGLHFDRVPRIIAHSASDGFHFFWSIICLCHDLGYRYEHEYEGKTEKLRELGSTEGRKSLLEITHDLLEVTADDLRAMDLDLTKDDSRWILESVELAKKYHNYRRRSLDNFNGGLADHGICGALLLYDILRSEYEAILQKQKRLKSAQPKRHQSDEPAGNLDGAAKDSSPTRFIRCSLLIACTVARHNMWLATATNRDVYSSYGLEGLFPEQDGVKVCFEKATQQMLFFLDFVDTIEPLKAFYLRDAEHPPKDPGSLDAYRSRLQRQKRFVLDHVSIDFSNPSLDPAHRSFSISADLSEGWQEDSFHRFCSSTSELPDWLKITKPTWSGNRIIYTLPFVPGVKQSWPDGIDDDEVNALLLYMGCGVPGRYERFYASTHAYQTFNLLMMKGQDGEKIRVCEEKQQPNGIFLEDWERSLETMEHIFTAQCKYARNKKPLTDILYRSDRKLNYGMMEKRGTTYAMTSTSQGSYLPEFLVNKVEPHILCIRMTELIPYFDYEGFFGEEYIYADEREILLPPMISLTTKQLSDVHLTAEDTNAAELTVPQYAVTLGRFRPDSMWEEDRSDKSDLNADLDFLKTNAGEAAAALDELAKTHDWKTSPLAEPEHVYWEWKRAYRRVLAERLKQIYSAEFPEK